MSHTTIIYRGAKTSVGKLVGRRANQLRQPVATTVQYRGAEGTVSLTPHKVRRQKISYRGATAEMEV